MQAIVQMCQKSLELKEKKLKKEKKEEAQEDRDIEGGVIYDGDEDVNDIKFDDDDSADEYDNWTSGDSDEESEGELEDSSLYNVCEVLFVKEKFASLETANPE